MSYEFNGLNESERELLRATRRSAARRTWLLIGLLVLLAIGLAWLTLNGPLSRSRSAAPSALTADQRALADGRRAMDAWARFANSNDVDDLRDWFWASGPQYKLLAKEAKGRRAVGPPAYRFTLANSTRVLAPAADQRVLRGRVEVTRPGEPVQRYNWDVWMRLDAENGRWRLWTVQPT